MSKYFGNFSDVTSVISSFSGFDGNYNSKMDVVLKDEEVLLAGYGTASYEGYAMVIFVRDGKYYEVHGSHCSCNGLEEQWKPEETTMEAIMFRIENMDEYGRERMIEEYGQEFYDALRGLIMFELFERKVLLS